MARGGSSTWARASVVRGFLKNGGASICKVVLSAAIDINTEAGKRGREGGREERGGGRRKSREEGKERGRGAGHTSTHLVSDLFCFKQVKCDIAPHL